MIDLRALLRVFDFFVPVEVLSAVLMVFAMENVLDYYVMTLVPPDQSANAWILVYLLGAASIGLMNLLTAETDDLEELADDLDDL